MIARGLSQSLINLLINSTKYRGNYTSLEDLICFQMQKLELT